ncbi:MAG: GNAT family N-acetyltransferase [Clostridiaceae bacterium]|nr:GNAT family N-acetyltransferase [Clostridiaceae bacterium]
MIKQLELKTPVSRIRKLEELSMNAWPSLQTKLYDGWVLRFSEGYTRRGNSVSPIYESTILLDEKIDFCEKEYGLQSLPTLFKLTTESNPNGIDERLQERGYIKENETSLRVLALSQDFNYECLDVVVKDQFSDEWLRGLFSCSNISEEQVQVTARRILGNILGPVIYLSKQVDGKIVGCGYGAIEGDYIGIFDIVVDKDFRGNGYGRDIMNGILKTAQQKNVTTAYLQVSAGNIPAEKLYDKIGFKEVYRYWYRKLEKLIELKSFVENKEKE